MTDIVMTDIELLRAAAELPPRTVDKMAHALGWPSLYHIAHGGRYGRIRWAHPYRNHFAGDGADPDWLAAAAMEMAYVVSPPSAMYPHTTWAVSPLGMMAVRLRLEAARRAYRLAGMRAVSSEGE